MAPVQKQITDVTTGTGFHAHLLVAEMNGKALPETPAAVMEEIEYRANHISLLMARMFEDSMRQAEWGRDEA